MPVERDRQRDGSGCTMDGQIADKFALVVRRAAECRTHEVNRRQTLGVEYIVTLDHLVEDRDVGVQTGFVDIRRHRPHVMSRT